MTIVVGPSGIVSPKPPAPTIISVADHGGIAGATSDQDRATNTQAWLDADAYAVANNRPLLWEFLTYLPSVPIIPNARVIECKEVAFSPNLVFHLEAGRDLQRLLRMVPDGAWIYLPDEGHDAGTGWCDVTGKRVTIAADNPTWVRAAFRTYDATLDFREVTIKPVAGRNAIEANGQSEIDLYRSSLVCESGDNPLSAILIRGGMLSINPNGADNAIDWQHATTIEPVINGIYGVTIWGASSADRLHIHAGPNMDNAVSVTQAGGAALFNNVDFHGAGRGVGNLLTLQRFSDAIVKNCTFEHAANGLAFAGKSAAEITDCTFDDLNHATTRTGGGDQDVELVGCTFTNVGSNHQITTTGRTYG